MRMAESWTQTMNDAWDLSKTFVFGPFGDPEGRNPTGDSKIEYDSLSLIIRKLLPVVDLDKRKFALQRRTCTRLGRHLLRILH